MPSSCRTIPVKPNTRYRASFYARAAQGFAGPIVLSIQSDDGRTVFARTTVSGVTPSWKQFEEILKTTTADTGVLVSATCDSRSRTIHVKLVNPAEAAAPVQIELTNATGGRNGAHARRGTTGNQYDRCTHARRAGADDRDRRQVVLHPHRPRQRDRRPDVA